MDEHLSPEAVERYLAMDLRPDEHDTVLAHLAACADCTATVELRVYGELGGAPLQQTLHRWVSAAEALDARRRRRWGGAVLTAVALAAAVVLVVHPPANDPVIEYREVHGVDLRFSLLGSDGRMRPIVLPDDGVLLVHKNDVLALRVRGLLGQPEEVSVRWAAEGVRPTPLAAGRVAMDVSLEATPLRVESPGRLIVEVTSAGGTETSEIQIRLLQ